MLRWTGERNGVPLIGLGVEEGNLERLREGKPIYIKRETLGIAFDIVIYYGKDMPALIEMTQAGIGPDTIIQDRTGAMTTSG